MPALRGDLPWHTQEQFPQFTPEAYWRIFGKSPIFGNPEKAQGYYDTIVQSAQAAGIAPSLLAAVMAQETGSGTSNAIKIYNNPGGLMSGNRHLEFDTLEAGILSTAQNLHNNFTAAYTRFGDYSVPHLREIWAPTNAPNDPRNLNRFWVSGVENFLSGIGNLGLPWADQANNNPTGWNPVIGLGGPEKLSTALHQGTGGEFWLDPNALRNEPGVLSPMLGSYLQSTGILPMDWGWDPTSNTWQNAPGAGSNWTLEQVGSLSGGPALQVWDVPGAGIQYRPGGIGSDANFPSGNPFAGNDPWPILQGGGGANVATGGIDLAHGLAQWFGGISRPGGGYVPSGEGYAGDPRGLFYTPSQLGYEGDPRGLFGNEAWLPAPAWYSGDPRDMTMWSGEPGKSNLSHIWNEATDQLVPWDPNLLNQPGAISPGLGGYLQSMNVFNPNMGYNPVDNVWQNAPPAPGWQLMDLNQYSPQAIPQLQQYFQSLFPTESFTNAFEGIGGFSQPNAVMNWVPPAPAGQQYQAGTGGFGYMGLPPQGTYPTMLPPEGTYGDQPAGATHVIPGIFGSSPVQDYGQPSVTQQIDATTAWAHAQAQAQVDAFNQQQAAHNAAAIAAAAASNQGVPTPGFGLPTQWYGFEFTPS